MPPWWIDIVNALGLDLRREGCLSAASSMCDPYGSRDTIAMSRKLAREQLLGWREKWSFTDKEIISHALDVLGETDYYEPRHKQHVCARAGRRVALVISPGGLYWTSPKWTEGLDLGMFPGGLGGGAEHKGRWYKLSTYVRPGPAQPSFEDQLRAPCPICFMIPSVAGECHCD
jgi:hypothetical protein